MAFADRVLFWTSCALIFGCATRDPGLPPRGTTPSGPTETQLVLLNIPEASGWVAFGGSGEASREYRIVVSRADSDEVIYESRIYLPADLDTHGFEMAHDDPRLLGIARQVDRDILLPLREATLEPEENAATINPAVPPAGGISPTILLGIEVLSADADSMELRQERAGILNPGDRLFLRTPAEFANDPDTGEQVMLSRGRVAALLEVTEVRENNVTVVRRSGEIPSAGYFQRAGN